MPAVSNILARRLAALRRIFCIIIAFIFQSPFELAVRPVEILLQRMRINDGLLRCVGIYQAGVNKQLLTLD